jgi:hypothetical protein
MAIMRREGKMPSPPSDRCATLSPKGMTTIMSSDGRNDFKSVVCGHHCVCPSVVAHFLSNSPRFAQFVFLGFGSSVLFESSHSPFLQSVCIEFESNEFHEAVSISNAAVLEGNHAFSR